ncbi:DUF1631 domain-containing protein [Metallibacterium sp.]|uniref:DUF1631 domain-containing protein n=1 Tax=Metallibacterium sp. TaxID=2940281 RepID=UPI002602E106|nr:DUF1631 domain-containing protein [Metallibacterium sp.]
MNAPEDTQPAKVVPMIPRRSDGNERPGELMNSVRTIASRNLQGLIAMLFDNLDDALFDLAEKAASNALQVEYFDGMRELRKKRGLIERMFIDDIGKRLADLGAGRLRERRTLTENGAARGELSLVEDAELEESLAVSSMASKAEQRLARNLFALNERLAVLAGGLRFDNALGPLDPGALAQAFRLALRDLETGMRVKLIVYKLFDRYVMSGAEAMYEELNLNLAQAGVLPQIRQPAASRGGSGNSAVNMVTVNAVRGGGHTSSEDLAAQADLLTQLSSLLAARRAPGETSMGTALPAGSNYGTGYPTGNAMPLPGPAELLGALTLLQAEIARANLAARSANEALGEVRHVKADLLDQVSRISGQARARVSEADEDTIDLVSMLFEFILQDRNLPTEMQALLARLQIPYLKVAILDRRLFAQRAHPARRLLDTLADAAKGWSRESDPDLRLLGDVRAVVERLLQDFDDDIGVFERLLREFGAQLETHRKRAELTELRAAEAARGREKLEHARRSAANAVLDHLQNQNPPQLVRSLLTRPWANYLVLLLLRQGAASPEYRAALHFMDDLLWSFTPKPDAASRQRLHALLPELERSLRQGLATVALQEPDQNRLLEQLNALYRPLLGEAPAGPVANAADATRARQAAQDIETALPPALEPEPVIPLAVQPDSTEVEPVASSEALDAVRALKSGCWFEFNGDDGSRERAKLSWISPISGRYLFVNRRGLKVADKAAAQLAAEIESGRAVLLEEVPLFDRALDAIVERLRNAQAAPDPGGA